MTATLCLKARTFFSPQISRTFTSPKHQHQNLNFPKPKFTSTIRMSSTTSSSSSPVVEHIVLFNVKPDTEPPKVNAMIKDLAGLTSLDLTLSLSAGPILRTRSSPFAFTHLLHSRYKSKDDLAAYTVHPGHMSVVKSSVLPICDDIMAVDWVSDELTGPVSPQPGSAVRVTFLKLKESSDESVKDEILGVIKGIKGKFGEVGQLSVGENFSPARAKGYSIASVAVFKGVSEMEAVDSKEQMVELEKEKVREHLESVIVLDYVVPSAPAASL